MIDPEFIERAREHVMNDPEYYTHRQNNKNKAYREENPERYKDHRKKYEQSEKGKIVTARRSAVREFRMKQLIKELSSEELEDIQEFYNNCPDGYHVDHIIPVAKGGKHTIENLQYLTPEENFKKATNLYWSSQSATKDTSCQDKPS